MVGLLGCFLNITSTFNRKRGKKSRQASTAAYFRRPQGQDLPMLRAKVGTSLNGILIPSLWGAVGFFFCVVGLLCSAQSLSFKSLSREWNPTTKYVVYAIIGLAISIVVLFADKCPVSSVFKLKLKAHFEFLVLMLTSLYFFADRYMKGKPDTWSVFSSVAFALTSLCLSLQIEPGFQAGLFNFLLGCLTLQLMKIHFIFILVAVGVSYPLVVFRSYLESQPEIGDSSDQRDIEIQIDNANSAAATQNEGIREQRSSSIGGARQWKWLQSFFRPDPQAYLLADEFPHLDIINDLLDDDGVGKASSVFHSLDNGPHINGHVDGLIQHQWQAASPDPSPYLGTRHTENDAYPYYPDYSSMACGANGYTVFRPSNWSLKGRKKMNAGCPMN